MPHSTHGTVVLMGSGEMAPRMVEVHKYAMSLVEGPLQPAFLGTPAGFQLNAGLLAEKAAAYFKQSLNADLHIIPLYDVHSLSPAELQTAISAIYEATYLFAGPGSPTYALKNWQGTPIVDAISQTLTRGGCLTFASAAALTLGRYTLPVYEIYKVGESLHWVDGLDLLAHYGLNITIVPHWNNTSGGDHDTNFCFMGEPRWQMLRSRLPAETTVLGIDEHTACILRLDVWAGEVRGAGEVRILHGGDQQVFTEGETFDLDLLNPENTERPQFASQPIAPESPGWPDIQRRYDRLRQNRTPSAADLSAYLLDLMALMHAARLRQDHQDMLRAEEALRESLVSIVALLEQSPENGRTAAYPFIELLVQVRADLRQANRWALADQIRDRLAELGVTLADTAQGSDWQFADE